VLKIILALDTEKLCKHNNFENRLLVLIVIDSPQYNKIKFSAKIIGHLIHIIEVVWSSTISSPFNAHLKNVNVNRLELGVGFVA
jgi:hypothetical protein